MGGFRHGHGKMTWIDGATFEGIFDFGMAVNGRFVWPSGESYDGSWANNMPCGKGSLEFAQSEYRGQIWAGLQHGRGSEVQRDKSTYVGEYNYG